MFTITRKMTNLIAGGSALLLTATAAPASFADHQQYEEPYRQINGGDIEFRQSRPISVFLDFRGGRNGRQSERIESRVLQELSYRLPGYVQLVPDHYQADLVLNVKERRFDMNFRIVDRDRKDKKYKKKYRYQGGQCGHYYRAFYTRVKEKGTAYYDYSVEMYMRGYGRQYKRIDGRASEKFSYGVDLTAQTNCGTTPTNIFPSRGVAELFDRNNPHYRRQVRREIRREAAAELGAKLANVVNYKVGYFYDDLARRINNGGGYGWQNGRGYGDDDYRYGNDRYPKR